MPVSFFSPSPRAYTSVSRPCCSLSLPDSAVYWAYSALSCSTLARSRSSSPAGSSMFVRMGFSLGVAVRRPFSSRMS